MDNIISLMKQKYSLLGDYNDKTSELLISDIDGVDSIINQREEIVTALKLIMMQIEPYSNSDKAIQQAITSGIKDLTFADSGLQALNKLAVESNKLIITIGNKEKQALEKLQNFKVEILMKIQASNQDKQLIQLYNSAIINDNSIGNSTDRRI